MNEIVSYPDGEVVNVNDKEFTKLKDADLIRWDHDELNPEDLGQWRYEITTQEVQDFLGQKSESKE